VHLPQEGKAGAHCGRPGAQRRRQLIARAQRRCRSTEDCFISGEDALLEADPKSLLIVVDTNRPDQVECPPLLESIPRVCRHRPPPPRGGLYRAGRAEPARAVRLLRIRACDGAAAVRGRARRHSAQPRRRRCSPASCWTRRTSASAPAAAPSKPRRSCAGSAQIPWMSKSSSRTICNPHWSRAIRSYRPPAVPHDIAMARIDYPVSRTIAAQAADELLNISGHRDLLRTLPAGRPGRGLRALHRRRQRADDS
jgi:hypothetical protein